MTILAETHAETVARNILEREHMPAPADIGDGEGITGAGGMTQAFCMTWGLSFPMTEAQAEANLQIWFTKSGLIDLISLSLPLGDAVADYCYAVSFADGVKALQGVLGVNPDGVIGPVTAAALVNWLDPARSNDVHAAVRAVAVSRIEIIAEAITSGASAPKFASGLIGRALTFI